MWKTAGGKEAGENGYYVMSDEWFTQYTYQVVVNKKYLTAQQAEELSQSPSAGALGPHGLAGVKGKIRTYHRGKRMRLKLSDILKATGGTLLCGDENTAVTSFITDSRQAKAGAMFVPIRGRAGPTATTTSKSVLESGAAASFADHPVPTGRSPSSW